MKKLQKSEDFHTFFFIDNSHSNVSNVHEKYFTKFIIFSKTSIGREYEKVAKNEDFDTFFLLISTL